VIAIGVANDQVGVGAAADTHEGHLLPAERVMGVEDRNQSQDGLGI
jgi:hypothetical protein